MRDVGTPSIYLQGLVVLVRAPAAGYQRKRNIWLSLGFEGRRIGLGVYSIEESWV